MKVCVIIDLDFENFPSFQKALKHALVETKKQIVSEAFRLNKFQVTGVSRAIKTDRSNVNRMMRQLNIKRQQPWSKE